MSTSRQRKSIARPDVEEPSALPRRAWGGVLKRTFSEFREDNVTDWAAALTYYGILSVFPALIALVSILGLIGQSATKPLLTNLGGFAPGPAHKILENALHGLTQSRGGASILFFVGLGGAIWSASSYIGAFIRASNSIWDVEEGRPIWKIVPLRLVITVVMLILLTATAVAVAVTGPLADKVGKLLGIGGGILAVVVWIIVSALFGIYVAKFGSYNKTYGSLGAIVIFLVWLWLTNVAILLGAELNAETERGRQSEAGQPADREPFLPPRTDPQ